MELTRTGLSSWLFEGELTFAAVTRMLTDDLEVDPEMLAVGYFDTPGWCGRP